MASALGTGIGSAEVGYGLSMNPSLNLQNPMTELDPDQQAIQQQMYQQQGMTDQNIQGLQGLYNTQNQQLSGIDQAQDQNLMGQLTSNDPTSLGSQLRGSFNNLGLSSSGAFDSSLANQFANLGQQQGIAQQQQQLGQTTGLANVLNQGAQTQSGLGQTGLQNTMGLESQGVDTTNAQALAQFMQEAGLQQSLVGGGLNTVGQSASGGKG